MRRVLIVVLTLVVAATRCIAAPDSGPPAPGSLPQSVNQFINDDTFLVIDFDLSRIDVATGTKQWLEPLASGTFEQRIVSAVINPFDAWAKRLRSDGAA